MGLFGGSDKSVNKPIKSQKRADKIAEELQAGQLQPGDVKQRLRGPHRPAAARGLVLATLQNKAVIESSVDTSIDELATRELARPIADSLLVNAERFRTLDFEYTTVVEESLVALEQALREIDSVRTGHTTEVLGGGSSELALAAELRDYADSVEGRQQLVAEATADAFEAVPQRLALEAGLDPLETLVEMRSEHANGGAVSIHVEEKELRNAKNASELAIEAEELRKRLTDGVALAGVVALTRGTVTQLGVLTDYDPYDGWSAGI